MKENFILCLGNCFNGIDFYRDNGLAKIDKLYQRGAEKLPYEICFDRAIKQLLPEKLYEVWAKAILSPLATKFFLMYGNWEKEIAVAFAL